MQKNPLKILLRSKRFGCESFISNKI